MILYQTANIFRTPERSVVRALARSNIVQEGAALRIRHRPRQAVIAKANIHPASVEASFCCRENILQPSVQLLSESAAANL